MIHLFRPAARVAAAFAHLAACVLIAVAVAPLAAHAADPHTLTLALNADIRTTEPGKTSDDPTGIVLSQIVEGLVAPTLDGTPMPMLAERIDVSADHRVYTFALRQGVRFHNGQPLDADAVVWTWHRYLDPKTNWSCRAYFDGTRGLKIQSVSALDALHVQFVLAQPSPVLLNMMARLDCDQTAILSPASVDAAGHWRAPVGTGPYVFGQWLKGQSISLTRYRDYRPAPGIEDGYAGDKTPFIDNVRFVVIPDEASIKAALEVSDIDIWYGINPQFQREFERMASLRVTHAPSVGPSILVLQTADPLLADVRVRRAIAMSIDAAAISKVTALGLAPVDGSLVSPANRFYDAVMQKRIGYDVAGARHLLASAGYHGQPIAISTTPRFKSMYDTALMVQAMGQQAGLNMIVKPLEFASMVSDFFAGHYQVMVFHLAPSLDPAFHYDRFIGSKATDVSKVWDDPDAQAARDRLMQASDDPQKQAAFDQLHELMLRDVPIIGLDAGAVTAAANRRVIGFAAWPGRRPRLWGIKLAQ
ncbi:ABC transporter substrate-binding protein [Caballeronia sp. LjRoot34]|uniref:ABC transporter substrate-binding protein n=1 Tax=Caballeronia sp. LjRoot34 TaxID=3342325 RepID=UPI003ECDEB6E